MPELTSDVRIMARVTLCESARKACFFFVVRGVNEGINKVGKHSENFERT